MAVKHAKILEKDQYTHLLKVVAKGEHPLRDEVTIKISFRCGLRPGEIAKLRWRNNILDAQGKVGSVLRVTSDVSKRNVERDIPMPTDLQDALRRLRARRPEDEFVFYALHNNVHPKVPAFTKRGEPIIDKETGGQKMIPDPDWKPGGVRPNTVSQYFTRLYKSVKYDGCSGHSGRRTAITVWCRKANTKNCSLRDVQDLAGHAFLDTTATYIEPSPHQHRLVEEAW